MAAKHSTINCTASSTNNYLVQNVNSAEVEKLVWTIKHLPFNMGRPSTADQKLGLATSPELLPGQMGPGLREAPKPSAPSVKQQAVTEPICAEPHRRARIGQAWIPPSMRDACILSIQVSSGILVG